MLVQQAHATAHPSSFIDPVPPAALSRASGKGDMDESSRHLREYEWRSYIRERRRRYNEYPRRGNGHLHDTGEHAPDDLTGIALSGGGIRSATFALGALQALAQHDLLRRFDYLSTVSGGGYIGTSLTWLTSRLAAKPPQTDEDESDETEHQVEVPSLPAGGFGLGPSDPETAFAGNPPDKRPAPFPYGSDDPQTAREPDQAKATGAMLRYLRQHGNYLTPGEGITLTSVIVVLLRGMILNLLVWIPIVAAVMWILIWLSVPRTPDLTTTVTESPHSIYPAQGASTWLAKFVGDISPPLRPETKAPISVLELSGTISPPLGSEQQKAAAQVTLAGGVSSDSPLDQTESPKLYAFGAMLAAVIFLFLGCVLAFAMYSLATWLGHKSRRFLLGGTKYGWRRLFERYMRVPFWAIAVLLLLASVPFVAGEFHGWLLGSSFSVIGLASGLVVFARTARQHVSRADKQTSRAMPSTWIASFGAAFLLYGVLLVSYGFAWWAAEGDPLLGIPPSVVLAAAFILAIVTGFAVDLNLITIHRFYRDRLMEAFLPDVDEALRNRTAPARQADSATLSNMCDHTHPVGPYHIINSNVVLTKSNERTYRLRGGDSFILTPLYCGSNATGWRSTRSYMGDELTVPTAMAISGAAANPWTAAGGSGVTRNPLVGMLMALMNLRLGFWVPNPNDDYRSAFRRSCKASFRANHFEPGIKEVLGISLREKAPVCLLSDGGHFENLALYELIRRRLRLIVLCDGTADPDYAFADLQNALARIGSDFGARVEFDKETTLQRFMPSIDAIYPRDVRLSESAYAIGQIIYADGSTGHLVYLTTALCKGLRLKLLGYKGANRDFPDQSTADQFFDEEQFEAYRELGYFIAENFIRHDMQNGGMLGQSIRPRHHQQAAA
jgi:hypothetical protein